MLDAVELVGVGINHAEDFPLLEVLVGGSGQSELLLVDESHEGVVGLGTHPGVLE